MFWQDRALTGTGCVFYGLAFAYALIALGRRREYPHAVFLALLVGGFLFQSFGLYVRGLEVHALPMTNTFEVFQVLAWFAVGLNFLLRQLFQLRLLNFFSSGFGFGLCFISLAVPAWDQPTAGSPPTGSPWAGFHAALAIASYGVFAVLALTSLMYLLQDRALTRRQADGWFNLLPAIRQLETLNAKLIALGVSLLTVAVGVGFLDWLQRPGAVGLAKLLIALTVWLAYLTTLLLRRRKRLLARKFARTCLTLFVIALISLWPLTTSDPRADGVDFLDHARD